MRSLNKGFTLAEVLITLLIIGIISSIVIPSIIQDTQDAQYKVAFKKNFGDLTQALKKASLDGTIKGRCSSGDHICFRNIFLPYLNYIKTCNSPNNSDCFASNYLQSGWQNGASVILSNGVAIIFYDYDSNCTGNQTGIFPGIGACGEALIDVNGYTKNNGKDVYWVEFTENNLRSNLGTGNILAQ
ncbi:MAG: prepilin-type N-terminal cleavage/methylation domain-containing protein [Candidatus Gastranaerophilales bacterium]|nr:prepilin-type N-terminal cleavage/methylation domain-containing protein [Candidatus Gastranaerophilales bacterium]